MAKELGHRGITVNAVLPGLVETDGVTAHDRQRFDQVAAMTPAGRNGRPDDIADVVAFLASDAARWVTGQAIAATGGLSF
ncbi:MULTISPECIES: SDR family oxidoreductase [Frankia]|uniref:SDR family oxidoreductase n=1 Tax=Frankia TaxID=1854 RepID=UPI0002FD3476|nr:MULTISPECIES: SDR family oxidoreductase [Frankia]